jgi:hypothetical protein
MAVTQLDIIVRVLWFLQTISLSQNLLRIQSGILGELNTLHIYEFQKLNSLMVASESIKKSAVNTETNVLLR